MKARTHVDSLPSGARYAIEVPEDWNGVLLLGGHPVPVGPGDPPWTPDEPLIRQLVASGFAVAGAANTIFWPLEQVFADQPAVLDIATSILGPPRHTIGYGLSIGGIISAGAVERFPDRLSGTLSMCGNLAGAVSNHNRELDIAFVVKTLLASDSDLQLTDIADPPTNLRLAMGVLHEAQSTAAGRARLALAAAVGNIPGWYDPTTPAPASDDFDSRQRNQFAWLDEVVFLVFFFARKQVEIQAGGNPSWNTGIDYAEVLSTSINRDEVAALYEHAHLDLADDLERLAAEPRISADANAVAYLERHIVFGGDLRGVPVLTLHTSGDGLVTPDHEHAYAEVVRDAGQQDLLRQLYVDRGGHCTFTFAEILTAIDTLVERVESGSWPSIAPAALNEAAVRFGDHANALASGQAMKAQFIDFDPPPFSRRYDARDVRLAGRGHHSMSSSRLAAPPATAAG